MATFLKTKNRIQAQVRLRGVKIFKTFSDKKSARAWATYNTYRHPPWRIGWKKIS